MKIRASLIASFQSVVVTFHKDDFIIHSLALDQALYERLVVESCLPSSLPRSGPMRGSVLPPLAKLRPAGGVFREFT